MIFEWAHFCLAFPSPSFFHLPIPPFPSWTKSATGFRARLSSPSYLPVSSWVPLCLPLCTHWFVHSPSARQPLLLLKLMRPWLFRQSDFWVSVRCTGGFPGFPAEDFCLFFLHPDTPEAQQAWFYRIALVVQQNVICVLFNGVEEGLQGNG